MRQHPLFRAYLALFAVYFFWGTTYLAIRMALEGIPALTLIGLRFLFSGGILLVASKFIGAQLPKGRELWLTSLYGIILLGGGNGALVFAEQWIPSGLAALFITTSPFWMVGIDQLLPGRERLHLPAVLGILLGFLGVLALVAPAAMGSPLGPELIRGFLVLQFGCIAWTGGSLLQRRQPTKAHPVVGGAIQQLATGIVFGIAALLIKQPPIIWTTRSVLALIYLVTFGSIVGFSAYVYALEKLPVAIVSTYTYVNPIVAVLLGWFFYREPFGVREAFAMTLIFMGVGVVKYYTPHD